ncbi:ROK family protein [Candidatus Kuenenbacteria bacterium]|nr:ROK family protein [Candidatus Kuenenbacteria bacterium]
MLISLDIGATKIICALVDDNFKIIKKIKIITYAKKGKKFVLQNIFEVIKKFWNKNVEKICLGFAGKIDSKKGIIIRETNFFGDFKNTPLKKILEKEFKVPVFLGNDAQCFVLGESIFGAGKNFNNVLGFTLGTGIGVGITINKKSYCGAHYLISEIAHHIIVEENGLKCNCGNRGCFEASTSGIALEKYYKILTKEKKTGIKIYEEALKNKKLAKKAILKVAKNLGIGLAHFVNIFDPDIVVLGGGLSEIKTLYKPAIVEMKKHLADKDLFKIPVVKSKLGENAIILGAAKLACSL